MVKGPERRELLGYLEARFGMPPGLFAGRAFFRKGRTYWLMASSGHLAKASGYQVHSVGLPFMKRVRGRLKPTTRGLQLLGRHATRNVVEIPEDDMARFLAGDGVAPPRAATPGYVVVTAGGLVLGCGLVIKEKKGEERRLISQIPKSVPLQGLLGLD